MQYDIEKNNWAKISHSKLLQEQYILRSYLNFLNHGCKSFGFNQNQLVQLKKSSATYLATSGSANPLTDDEKNFIEMFSRGTNHYHNHGLESISSCAEAVRQIRRKQKRKSAIYSNKVDGQKVFKKEREYPHGFFNGQSVHKKFETLSECFAQKWWRDNQSRTNIIVKVDALSQKIYFEKAERGRAGNYSYNSDQKNGLSLTPSWFKNVFMKGLPTTIYKSKTAFIAKATPLEVSEKIKAQNLKAYVVDVVTCYDGIIDVEYDLYCLAYQKKPSEQLKIENDYGGNLPLPQGEAHRIGLTNNIIYTPAETINSVSSNFRRAENVMTGRVQKNMLDAMGV